MEGKGFFRRTGNPESKVSPSGHLETPFHRPTLDAFVKEFPEKREALETVLSAIDREGVENFAVFHSEKMPGVSFSYTKLEVTQKIIEELIKGDERTDEGDPSALKTEEPEHAQGSEENTQAKKQDYFLFTAFAPPPDGHAFTVEDVGIDRYIRLLPRVANAMREERTPPDVNIYLLGAPTGFGGSVTDAWIKDIGERGLEAHGQLYAEFVNAREQEGNNSHIVLQGVSKGAVVAEKVTPFLREDLKDATQRLLDNPAGDHTPGTVTAWLKGGQVAAGLTAETIARAVFDNAMMKPLMKGGKFIDDLSKKTGIAKDTSEQLNAKRKAAFAEGVALLKGSSMDTEHTRSHIRRAIYDPLTLSPSKLLALRNKPKDLPFISDTNGKVSEFPIKGNHFFIYNRYKRWATILDFAAKSNSAEQKQQPAL